MAGIFEVLGKIAQWVPSRDESRRNKIEKIQKEMYKLQNGERTSRNLRKYLKLSERLRILQREAKNH